MSKTRPTGSLGILLLGAACLFLTGRTVVPAAEPAPTAETAPGPAQDPNRAAPAPGQDASVVVARLGEHTVLRKELEERLVREIQPREEDIIEDFAPVTAEGTLRLILAEKAMMLEGRRLGYLKDEIIRSSIEQAEQQQLVRMLLENHFREHASVSDADIDQAMKEDPKLSREQATMAVQQAAAARLFESFYAELTKKFQLKQVEGNFAPAAQVHQRLLQRPVEPRGPGEYWIKNSQVRSELSEAEKNLPLATYEGGQFTLKDWFQVICNMAPPRRPTDLGTPAGVEKLLDRALRAPILVAEAKARGYEKDAKLRAGIRQLEDQRLLYKVQEEKTKGVAEPTAEQIKSYFEKNKEKFAQGATLKIDQIWCEDLQAAQKVRAALEEGGAFADVKKTYSLQKDSQAYPVSAGGEGLFWAALWKADPNQTVGPVRGFYGGGIKWRVVRILEKTPAKVQPYSEQIANRVKWAMMDEQRRRLLEDYRKELLAKYAQEIFRDKIQGIDPLEIAMRPTP